MGHELNPYPSTYPTVGLLMSIFTEFKWKQKVTSLINQILGRTSSLERTTVELADEDNDINLRLSQMEERFEQLFLKLGVKVGQIIPYSGSSIPDGYLLCNGANIDRTTYADLFSKIGTLYGAGDGSTTFTIPNIQGRFLEGASSNIGSYVDAGLPNISARMSNENGIANNSIGSGSNDWENVWWNASAWNAIYGRSSTVQPAAVRVYFIIKY